MKLCACDSLDPNALGVISLKSSRVGARSKRGKESTRAVALATAASGLDSCAETGVMPLLRANAALAMHKQIKSALPDCLCRFICKTKVLPATRTKTRAFRLSRLRKVRANYYKTPCRQHDKQLRVA